MPGEVRLSSVVVDRTAEPDYRALHPMAIISALLGVFSILAFALPIFWVIPVAGILAGALALRAVHREPEVWGGERLAQFGLAASLGLGAAAVASTYLGWYLLKRDAVRTAEIFMDHLRNGRIEQAFWMTVPQEWRQEFDPTVDGENAKEHFQRFLAAGARYFLLPEIRPEVEFEEVEEYGTQGGDDYALVRYRIHRGEFSTYAVVHVMTVRNTKTGRKEWYVAEFLTNYTPGSKKIQLKHHH